MKVYSLVLVGQTRPPDTVGPITHILCWKQGKKTGTLQDAIVHTIAIQQDKQGNSIHKGTMNERGAKATREEREENDGTSWGILNHSRPPLSDLMRVDVAIDILCDVVFIDSSISYSINRE